MEELAGERKDKLLELVDFFRINWDTNVRLDGRQEASRSYQMAMMEFEYHQEWETTWRYRTGLADKYRSAERLSLSGGLYIPELDGDWEEFKTSRLFKLDQYGRQFGEKQN